MTRLLSALKNFDARRPSLPGEHLLTFGAGALTLRAARGRASRFGQLLALLVGTVLIWRSLSGRDGVRRLVR